MYEIARRATNADTSNLGIPQRGVYSHSRWHVIISTQSRRLFLSLPLNLITCSKSPTYQKRAKKSRMTDRMPSICQKYLSDPGPEWADHRPSPQTHTDGSGVDNCSAWPPRKPTKDAQSITTTNLPNSHQILRTQKKTAEGQIHPTGPEDRASPAPDTDTRAILTTTWGWHAYHFSSSLNSREGTVVFLMRVREHSTGLFSELKPLLPWSGGFPDRLACVRTEWTWYESFC